MGGVDDVIADREIMTVLAHRDTLLNLMSGAGPGPLTRAAALGDEISAPRREPRRLIVGGGKSTSQTTLAGSGAADPGGRYFFKKTGKAEPCRHVGHDDSIKR
jgi:hypothetical protein